MEIVTEPAADLNLHRMQTAALLMHFDEHWVGRVLHDDVLRLTERERDLLSRIDPRAFRADEQRQARCAHAIVDELPVAVAVVGLPRVFSFFTSPDFLVLLQAGTPLVEGVAQFLGSVALVEGSIARARRRRQSRGPCTLAPGVDAQSLPGGTLVCWTAVRNSLGPNPAAAVRSGARGEWKCQVRAADGDEGVIVDHALVDARVASCTPELALLLIAAREGQRAGLLDLARSQGLSDDEAEALLLELQADGLLAAVV